MTKFRSLLSQYGTTVFSQAAFIGLTAYTGVLASRMLGPAGRGELAAIIIWPSMLTFFVAFGVNQAIVFHAAKNKNEISETFTASAILGLFQSLILVAAGLVLVPHALHSYSFEVRHLGIAFVLVAPALLIGGYPANIFQARRNMFAFNTIRLLPVLIYASVLTLLFAKHSTSLTNVVTAQLIGFIGCALIGWTWIRISLSPRWAFSGTAIKGIVRFGGKAQISNVSAYLNQRFDQVILSLLVPPEQLGLYAVAVTAASIVAFLPNAVGMVTLSAAASENPAQAHYVISRSVRVSLAWLLAGGTLMFILCPTLIRLVFGLPFAGSVVACRILVPGMVATGLCQVLYNGATAVGKPALPSYSEGVGLLVTAVGLLLFIPKFGYVGAAVVSSCAYWVSLLVALRLFRSQTGITWTRLLLPRPAYSRAVPVFSSSPVLQDADGLHRS